MPTGIIAYADLKSKIHENEILSLAQVRAFLIGGNDMNTVQNLINIAVRWTGYLEKKSNKDLDDFTANAGKNNYTCFARDYKTHTGENYQAQPWCAMFVSEIFVQAFGLDIAKKMLGGSLYHYCPTGVNQFKAIGRWSQRPEPGAVIFFTNGTRAYHTGIVTEVTSTKVKTIEGNTSGAVGVVENGGGVFRKSYSKTDPKILGYGIPDWSLAAQKTYSLGWNYDSNGWWYADTENSYYKSCWKVINHHKYYFNQDGYAVTDWQEIGGKWYYFEPRKGHQFECALYITDKDGVQAPGEFGK